MANDNTLPILLAAGLAYIIWTSRAAAVVPGAGGTGGDGVPAGGGVTGGGSAGAASGGARGIRNNNPGNLVKSSIAWQGKVAGTDPNFETFDTPQNGIRALVKNVLAKVREGSPTIRSIITQWAPPSENNTAAYIANVAAAVGVSPDATINANDSSTMIAIANAIIQQENGSNPFASIVPGVVVGVLG